MKPRTFVPRKLDIGAFIDSGEVLEGTQSVADLQRLAEGLYAQADLAALPPVQWRVQGRLVKQRVGQPHRWLDVEVKGTFPWECQRCLHSVDLPIEVARSIRFVDDEAAAAALDADSDDDVLAVSRVFDLLALLEDELIMAQPLVPRHEQCPTDVERHMRSFDPDEPEAPESGSDAGGKPHPFAALAALKKNQN
ncbi:YceD family protein [Aquabacterium sp.]|uniref:YceD family protein n=1 Tax=Aquabacterium sp. TaxID=1872578 RepID=UPI002E310754|nr:YceD family protein [Aquabacterium sp.]HEX5312656.1 YceD family protein [Aquabacterium sp.]